MTMMESPRPNWTEWGGEQEAYRLLRELLLTIRSAQALLAEDVQRETVGEEAAFARGECSEPLLPALRALLAGRARLAPSAGCSDEPASARHPEREECGRDGAFGLVATLRQLYEALRLCTDGERCTCAELAGERCRWCEANEALDLGEGWLQLLDPPPPTQVHRSAGGERYFASLPVVQLLSDLRTAAFYSGSGLPAPRPAGEKAALLDARVEQVLAHFSLRLEGGAGARDLTSFLPRFIEYWMERGAREYASHEQGADAWSRQLAQPVRVQVHHADAPEIDWGTTQSALQVSLMMPHLLVSLLTEPGFQSLLWSVAGVSYRLSRGEEGEMDHLC